jgi:SHS2 domain-containing protein
MKQFETIDISGDAGLRAFGKDLPELFANAGIGMYSLMTDLSGFSEEKSIEVIAESETLDGLFIAWLNELIFRFDTYGFVGRRIDIKTIQENRIEATISGEEFDPGRHEGKLLIKAATYHRLKVEKKDDHWEAEVIFDI